MSSFFVTLWTVAHQAPLSMGFSRQEYWSGLPFPSPSSSSFWCLSLTVFCFLQPLNPFLESLYFIYGHQLGDFFFSCKNYQWLCPQGNPQALRNIISTSFKQSETSVSFRFQIPSQFQNIPDTFPANTVWHQTYHTVVISETFFLALNHKFFLLLLVGWLVGFVCLLFVSSI